MTCTLPHPQTRIYRNHCIRSDSISRIITYPGCPEYRQIPAGSYCSSRPQTGPVRLVTSSPKIFRHDSRMEPNPSNLNNWISNYLRIMSAGMNALSFMRKPSISNCVISPCFILILPAMMSAAEPTSAQKPYVKKRQ